MSDKNYFLTPEGLYNPLGRYAFTNITEEPFVTSWDGQPITVPPGVTVEVNHTQICNFTKQLVDKIIIGNAKLDEIAKNQPYYRSPVGADLGVPAKRKIWEDKIARELEIDEESPQTQIMRAKIREELMADMAREPSSGSPALPASIGEFADLNTAGSNSSPAKAPARIKVIKN